MKNPIVTEFDEESGEWELAETEDDEHLLNELIDSIDTTIAITMPDDPDEQDHPRDGRK